MKTRSRGVATIYLVCIAAVAANRHGLLAVLLTVAGWCYCAWRVVLWMREQREREAHRWEGVDLTRMHYQTQDKGR